MAQKVMKYFGYFCMRICHQELKMTFLDLFFFISTSSSRFILSNAQYWNYQSLKLTQGSLVLVVTSVPTVALKP